MDWQMAVAIIGLIVFGIFVYSLVDFLSFLKKILAGWYSMAFTDWTATNVKKTKDTIN